jgi:superfamily II RNA helicase
MIYLPQRIPLLMLSATVGNDQQIADWLTSIRSRPCTVVREKQRPVPLYPLFLHPAGTLLPLTIKNGKGSGVRLSKKVGDLLSARHQPRLAPPGQLPPFGAILQILRKYNLLPAIFFMKSRADCDRAIQMCVGNYRRSAEHTERLNDRIGQLIDNWPHVRHHRQRWLLEHAAVGAHHSGQLPAWKQVLESLMSDGLLDAIFATSTVAAGVDFPARTVAFLNSDRFNGREFAPLDTTELLQMTGRAGRRGRDNIGFALVIPGKYMDVRKVAKLLHGAPGPVHSQIRINFSMTLNLLLSHTPEQVEQLLRRSLAAFQGHGEQFGGPEAAYHHLWTEFQRHLDFLKNTGFVDPEDHLTADGMWASQLRIDQPLLVAECLRQSLFPPDNPALLAAVMASFVNEKESDEHLDTKALPKSLVRAMDKVFHGVRGFAKFMISRHFDVRPLYLKPAATVWAWAAGHAWNKVIQTSQMTEGDLAMLVLRTADHLRHLAGLTQVFPRTAATARKAIELILRDPVMPDRPGPVFEDQDEG